MFVCPKCKTEYAQTVNFCGVCGSDLKGAASGMPERAQVADPFIGMVVAERYRLVELLGRGGMGVVYKAEHVRMGKLMAIKLLHGDLRSEPNVVGRFKREAQAASQLTNVNTVQIFDFGTSEGLMYLVMEYIEGKDLSTIIRTDGHLDFIRVAAMSIQILGSLGEAHEKGIVHRDLKPENVIVSLTRDQEEFVKVLDFGLAQVRETPDRKKLTADGSILGTPYYMSPEHISGDKVDGRADLYALGCVMYQALTGDPPFTGKNPMAVISSHLTESPEPVCERFSQYDIPPQADQIIAKAMAKKPGDRFASADDMRSAIFDVLDKLGGMDSPTGRVTRGQSTYELGSPPTGAQTSGWESGEMQDIGSAPTFMASVKDLPAVAPSTIESPAQKEEKKPVKTGAIRKSKPKLPTRSVLIDGRTLSISTKMDFEAYEKNLKRKKIIIWSLLPLLIILAAGIAGWIFYQDRARISSTGEWEPNNNPEEAKPLQVDTPVQGHIGAMLDPQTPDNDWYSISLPGQGPWLFRAEVTGISGVDLVLQMVRPGLENPEESTVTGNSGKKGDPEAIASLGMNTKQVYLLVREFWQPRDGVPPKMNVKDAYSIQARLLDPAKYETEPNDEQVNGSRIEPGGSMKGWLAHPEDADWYCLPRAPVGGKGVKVTLSGIPDTDTKLTYAAPSGAPVEVNNAPAGKGEVLEAAVSGDSGCIQVAFSEPPDDEKGRAFDEYTVSVSWTENAPPPPPEEEKAEEDKDGKKGKKK